MLFIIKSIGGYLNFFLKFHYTAIFHILKELQYNPVLYAVNRLARCCRQIFLP